jgi:hypothetical protein
MKMIHWNLDHNENDPLEPGPGNVAQETGELLYHFAVLCAYFLLFFMTIYVVHVN